MNVHLYQDYDAKADLEFLSSTKSNYISPQASKSNVSIIQDCLLASFLMTRDDSKIEQGRFFNICMHGDGWSPDYILKKIQHIRKVQKSLGRKVLALNGKGLVSLILPEDFYYEKKNDASRDQPIVKIYKGVMLEGALNKSLLGASHNSIIQSLYKQYGVDISADFVNNIQFLSNAWLIHRGFTISIKDCVPKNKQLITETVQKSLLEAQSISETKQHPKIIEAKINNTFSKAKDVGLRISKESMTPDNGFVCTVTSGSRGDFFNIAQITGILGQTNVAGQRIKPMLNKGKRTLPHYQFDETNIEKKFESRGFIKSSFIKGLNPKEFWFHAMSGREGVSDTAMKTAQSGYIQRKMVKVMEDVQVKYDGTVRNSSNNIIQWAYGGDGLDRTQSVVISDKTEICDISSIANKLNKKYEKK
jgi:DNA-directed RNA polymerase beta' subunit